MIRLSVPELRALLAAVVWEPVVDAVAALAWSLWRRTHQYRVLVDLPSTR